MSKASVNKENILANPNKKAEEAHNKDVQALKDLINQKEKLEARLEAKFKEQERQLAAQNEILKQQQLQINSMLKLLSSSAPAIKSTSPSNDRMAVPVK
jgi:HEAT repeat protein